VETTDHYENMHILADPLRMRELLLNLIENGIKYTEDGGSVRVALLKESQSRGPETGLQKEPEFIKIIVSDTGIGIAKEDQERVFDRFFRADKARSRELGGSGLGLSICKWIVEAHRGDIAVESDLGNGSSFIVTLPVYTPSMVTE
jgi:two-component system phosphate regulon sensor histidine kinase PhoR